MNAYSRICFAIVTGITTNKVIELNWTASLHKLVAHVKQAFGDGCLRLQVLSSGIYRYHMKNVEIYCSKLIFV